MPQRPGGAALGRQHSAVHGTVILLPFTSEHPAQEKVRSKKLTAHLSCRLSKSASVGVGKET